jgi:Protein of unknown function (DUF2917)
MMTAAIANGTSDGRLGLICINEGSPRHVEGSDLKVINVDGSAWITLEGDQHDYVIGPGEEIRLVGEGRVVIEALTPLACVRVISA